MAYWSAIAGIASGIYKGYEANQAANNAGQLTEQELQQKFQDQVYQNQEARKYTLEDRNAHIKNVQSFGKYAPAGVNNFMGKGPPPQEALYDTSGLGQFDPSQTDNSNPDSLMQWIRTHPDG
jgi:hypothetical protein